MRMMLSASVAKITYSKGKYKVRNLQNATINFGGRHVVFGRGKVFCHFAETSCRLVDLTETGNRA